jgi:hypothetical protein
MVEDYQNESPSLFFGCAEWSTALSPLEPLRLRVFA